MSGVEIYTNHPICFSDITQSSSKFLFSLILVGLEIYIYTNMFIMLMLWANFWVSVITVLLFITIPSVRAPIVVHSFTLWKVFLSTLIIKSASPDIYILSFSSSSFDNDSSLPLFFLKMLIFSSAFFSFFSLHLHS